MASKPLGSVSAWFRGGNLYLNPEPQRDLGGIGNNRLSLFEFRLLNKQVQKRPWIVQHFEQAVIKALVFHWKTNFSLW